MSKDEPKSWTPEQAAAYAAVYGLSPPPDKAELERLCAMGERVAATARSIARMPFKSDEPASVFKVPLQK